LSGLPDVFAIVTAEKTDVQIVSSL